MSGQLTLSRSSRRLEGAALDVDRAASVRFHPAPPDTGLVFVRADLPGGPELPCRADYLLDQPRWTSLAASGVVVHHTEHVLAAVRGLGIDNLRIELNSDRLPVLDAGSARPFVEALLEAGFEDQGVPREVLCLSQGVSVEAPLGAAGAPASGAPHRSRWVLGLPHDGFAAAYLYQAIQADRELVAFAEHAGSHEEFSARICCARSYYLESEADEVGRLLNPLHTSFIELGPRSSQEHVNEVARHKLLDFLGDLAVLGLPVLGRFVAVRSGHALHHALVRKLATGGLLERRRLD